jgi:hypothetical protein
VAKQNPVQAFPLAPGTLKITREVEIKIVIIMKNVIVFFWVTFMYVGMFTSCATFYQVYTSHAENMSKADGCLIYEDEHCIVSYNLWSEGGDIGFTFYNKTEHTLYLDMEKCFFIRNGIAYDYFQNRTYTHSAGIEKTKSTSAGIIGSIQERTTAPDLIDPERANSLGASISKSLLASQAVSSYKGFSVSHAESPQVAIPSKSLKFIAGFPLNEILYRSCDLLQKPGWTGYTFSRQKAPAIITFDRSTTPLVFRNELVYHGDNIGEKKIENSFYVLAISNLPRKEMLEYRSIEFCGEREMSTKAFFRNSSPDKFYIRYKPTNTH